MYFKSVEVKIIILKSDLSKIENFANSKSSASPKRISESVLQLSQFNCLVPVSWAVIQPLGVLLLEQ